jgi:hypothetical protein
MAQALGQALDDPLEIGSTRALRDERDGTRPHDDEIAYTE